MKSWRDKQVEEQEKLPKNVDPVLTIQTIAMKHSSIEREVINTNFNLSVFITFNYFYNCFNFCQMRYLMSKFTSWKPKKKEEPKAKGKC